MKTKTKVYNPKINSEPENQSIFDLYIVYFSPGLSI